MKENSSVARYIITISVSVCIAALFSLLLLMAFAALSVSADDPTAFVAPMAYTVLAAASVLCGVCAVLMNKRSIFPCYLTGGLSGAVLVLVIFILSFLPMEGVCSPSGPARAFIYGAVILLSLLGGLFARPRAKKHARARMKRRYR